MSTTERSTILLVSISQVYGGAETYYVKLAKILLSQHNIVAVVNDRRLETELRALQIEVLFAPDAGQSANRYIATLRACQSVISRFRPRIAHLNGQPESYLAPFLRLMGLRLLTTRHTPFTDSFLKYGFRFPVVLKRWLVLLSLRCATHTICVSETLHRQLAAYLPAKRLSVIPTWVDDSFLENTGRPAPSQPLRALFVGRVVPNKGVFDAIEAVRRCENIELTVVGEGDQMEEAQRAASGLPIIFSGFKQDCRPAYRASDLLIFPAWEGFEGLPQVPLEAMAMGLPVLASDISCVLELAGAEAVSGSSLSAKQPAALALYRQGDVDDFARSLNELAANPTELLRLSAAGREQVERHFTTSTIAPRYLAEFAEACK